jgi:hypothetical protein
MRQRSVWIGAGRAVKVRDVNGKFWDGRCSLRLLVANHTTPNSHDGWRFTRGSRARVVEMRGRGGKGGSSERSNAAARRRTERSD